MHEAEVHIDVALVQQLMAEQFPACADLPIRETDVTGTMNALYRVGDELCARLPRVAAAATDLAREAEWLPWLTRRLSFPIPEPIAAGRPNQSYPFAWALYRWIDGTPYSDEGIDDEAQAGRDLARFVLELRQLDASRAPHAGRKPLRDLDTVTRLAIEKARGVIDADAALAAWRDAIESPVWTGERVWIHADLLRPNVLVHSGRIHAVLDFAAAGAGDPAADVIAAWSIFGAVGRAQFRSTLNVDDDTWRRGRGFALHQAAVIIPYYSVTNPRFAAEARRTVERVLLDCAANSRQVTR